MNEGAIIAIFCVLVLPLVFGAGYIAGRAGGFRELFEFPELPELLKYEDWEPLPLDPLPNAYVAGGSDVSLDTVSEWRGASWDELIEQSEGGIT